MKNKHTSHFRLAIIVGLSIFWGSCKDKDLIFPPQMVDVKSEVANAYFDLAIKMTKETPGFTPPVAARAYGYTGVTLYESVVGGMSEYESLQGKINGLSAGALPNSENGKEYHWGLAANSALAEIMGGLYKTANPDNLTALSNLKQQYEQQFSAETSSDVADRSIAFGEAIGKAMYKYSKTDGQDAAYTTNFPASYIPPVFPGAWVPTPPTFQKALQPYWGQVRPFLSADTAAQPIPHPAYSTASTSVFYAQALEVYAVTSDLTPEQSDIALFWSDDPGKTGTPPGHSLSIAKQALEKEEASLAVAAETYAKVGMAVHDAFVSCWKCKYAYNLMRPVTYIQQNIDPAYTTLLTTPPFPEFTSGHSAQAGASMQILSDIFGYNFAFTDNTHVARTDIDGSPRSFTSFMDAANEAAISRLYGGIHYRAAIDYGIEHGREIGENIGAIQFKK